jgi:hypothetical protein
VSAAGIAAAGCEAARRMEGERGGAAGIAAVAAWRMIIDIDGRSAGGCGDGR